MVFLPNDDKAEAEARAVVAEVCAREGVKLVGWRAVPVAPEVVGRFAKATQPRFAQVVIEGKAGQTGDALEKQLFVVRKLIEGAKGGRLGAAAPDFYFCSLSCRTIIYKGMLRSVVVGQFYKDLVNPLFESAFAIYHRRFSTNTTPKWPLAQPFRILGHNGASCRRCRRRCCRCAAAVCRCRRRRPALGRRSDAQPTRPVSPSSKLCLTLSHSLHPTTLSNPPPKTLSKPRQTAGEINTLQGNLNWVASREHTLEHPTWGGREEELTPLCNAAESDSANLDHVAEILVRTGFGPEESLMLLVPEAYRNHPDLMKEYPEARVF